MTLLEILHQMSAKGLFEKIELKQEPVTVSDAREVYLSIMFFLDSLFCSPMFERHTIDKQKKSAILRILKNATC